MQWFYVFSLTCQISLSLSFNILLISILVFNLRIECTHTTRLITCLIIDKLDLSCLLIYIILICTKKIKVPKLYNLVFIGNSM